MDQIQESQRRSYLVVPHSARSPVENTHKTRGSTLTAWGLFCRPQCPPSQEGFNERQQDHRQSSERRGANAFHLTKPLNDPAQTSGEPEWRRWGVAAVGVCAGGEGRGPSEGTL